jgi:hypothetical protein
MSTRFGPQYLDACPFCGVVNWTDFVHRSLGPAGDELSCSFCGACVWQGVVVDAGRRPDPDEIARAVRAQFPRASLHHPAYIAPENRQLRVSFTMVERPPAPESSR